MKKRFIISGLVCVGLALALAASLGQAQEPEWTETPATEQGLESEGAVLPEATPVWSWQQQLGQDGLDNYRVQRRPSSTQPWVTLLTLSNVGDLTLKGNKLALGANTRLQRSSSTLLDVYVNNQRALRMQSNATSPNLIGGYNGNNVTSGVVGAVIGGGGRSGYANRVADDYGTVGGGVDNQAGYNSGITVTIPTPPSVGVRATPRSAAPPLSAGATATPPAAGPPPSRGATGTLPRGIAVSLPGGRPRPTTTEPSSGAIAPGPTSTPPPKTPSSCAPTAASGSARLPPTTPRPSAQAFSSAPPPAAI